MAMSPPGSKSPDARKAGGAPAQSAMQKALALNRMKGKFGAAGAGNARHESPEQINSGAADNKSVKSKKSLAGKSNRSRLEQETTPGPDRPIQDAKSPPKSNKRPKSPGSSRSKKSK